MSNETHSLTKSLSIPKSKNKLKESITKEVVHFTGKTEFLQILAYCNFSAAWRWMLGKSGVNFIFKRALVGTVQMQASALKLWSEVLTVTVPFV